MSRVSRLLGEDDDDESLIPGSATPFVPREERDRDNAMQKKMNATSAKEPLIDPEVALVAPDATPRATVRLSPHQVPSSPETTPPAPSGDTSASSSPTAPNAVSVMLGRARRDNSATPSVLPGIPSAESFQPDGDESGAKLMESHGSALAAATTPGSGMPDPAPRTDGTAIYNAFRRLGGPR